jgi:hypothetical protein
MSIESILAQIDAEIARLTQVRKLLASSGSSTLTAKTAKTKRSYGPIKHHKIHISPFSCNPVAGDM